MRFSEFPCLSSDLDVSFLHSSSHFYGPNRKRSHTNGSVGRVISCTFSTHWSGRCWEWLPLHRSAILCWPQFLPAWPELSMLSSSSCWLKRKSCCIQHKTTGLKSVPSLICAVTEADLHLHLAS